MEVVGYTETPAEGRLPLGKESIQTALLGCRKTWAPPNAAEPNGVGFNQESRRQRAMGTLDLSSSTASSVTQNRL